MREARVQDIDSVGQAYTDLLSDMASAREAKNWTALAAFTRTRAQILGMVKEGLHVSFEASLSDDQLIKALAAGDSNKDAVLRTMLGTSDGFKQ